MTTNTEVSAFLAKAEENLVSAASELANGRYNACANRCYYACFQAAIVALLQAGIRPPGGSTEWGHAFVQAQFAGQLITRRRLYSASLRDVLPRLFDLRRRADYETAPVSANLAMQSVRRSDEFIAAIRV